MQTKDNLAKVTTGECNCPRATFENFDASVTISKR